MDSYQQLQKKVDELMVVESELTSLRKGAKVYKQQPNSFIYFRDDCHQALNDCRKQLHQLRGELEKMKTENMAPK
ncbi:hypothetical protein HOLleu_34401 [Holothuria leucospilota]|uniref:Uncharacterized protein n=1 Tax=Holothuria leucospilota TaxID=206669 RepID=A0A9Q1BG81_HOLLE|nr:hypothetical protein HOLleu_34401 [Holothuria leucospilota]